MPLGAPTSVCTLGIPIDIYWYGCVDPAGHINAAIDALFEAIDAPDRVWSPHAEILVKQEFRSRLNLAAAGELKPVDHVKAMGGGGDEHIFEIRWNAIPVTMLAEGVKRFAHVEARMLHSEPAEVNVAIVGLHAHEKTIYVGDDARTHAEQDAHVAEAVRRYHEGRPTKWGIGNPNGGNARLLGPGSAI